MNINNSDPRFNFCRAGPSLSAFNYDSNYGKKALTMVYKGIMEQVCIITVILFFYDFSFFFHALYTILRVGFKVTRILFQLFLQVVLTTRLASKNSLLRQRLL
jgi:hypothetical protein